MEDGDMGSPLRGCDDVEVKEVRIESESVGMGKRDCWEFLCFLFSEVSGLVVVLDDIEDEADAARRRDRCDGGLFSVRGPDFEEGSKLSLNESSTGRAC